MKEAFLTFSTMVANVQMRYVAKADKKEVKQYALAKI
jgi:hypothetical protein